MNSSDEEQDRDLLARYGQASRAEARVPRAAVRAAILEEGRRAAVSFAESARLRRRRWRMSAVATAATVLMAALVIAPRLVEHDEQNVRGAQPAAAKHAVTPPVPAEPAQTAPAPPQPAENSPPRSYAERNAAMSASSRRYDAAVQSSASEYSRARRGASRALLAAASAGDDTTAIRLLDGGAHVDERDPDGRTPLMLAAAAGRLDMVRLLLAHGADPNAADESGSTALKQAQQQGFSEIDAALTRAGAR